MAKANENSFSLIDKSWASLNAFIEGQTYTKIVVLVDSNTLQHCLPKWSVSIEREFQIIEVEPGEASKDLSICAHIWSELTEEQMDRNALIVCLGGGVVCDLGGFIASLYKRGVDFMHLPTSLLAMVDASIGGKCGVDFMGYKNQLGVIKEPVATFVDYNFLDSLPEVELSSGFAEMLKHALISDSEHWSSLTNLNSLTRSTLSEFLLKSMMIKREIVALDPLEKGLRKKLNFGHTLGHAVESYYMSKEMAIPHGYAVAAGLYMESFLSHDEGFLSQEEFLAIKSTLERHYAKLDFKLEDIESIFQYLLQDKKRKEGKHQLCLLKSIGELVIDQACSDDQLKTALEHYQQNYGA